MNIFRIVIIFVAIFILSACARVPTADKLSSTELQQLEIEAQIARKSFQLGNYDDATNHLLPLSKKQSINQPLYQLELASVYLVTGEKENAHQVLLAAHHSIEGFFDVDLEQKAASLWGKEADKVFKGEPYERASLYFLLALSFLEQNNPDNALAALKTGLLADADTEKKQYKSDFGLLQLLAAKCYDIRGNPDLRDQMLNAAFASFISVTATSHIYSDKLLATYAALKKQQGQGQQLTGMVARLCSIASAQSIENWLRNNNVPPDTAIAVAKWSKKATANINPLDYNALVVVWRGSSPQALRSGQFGEIRLIQPGEIDTNISYAAMVNSSEYKTYSGFGDINYQATTRGGREMDNVLKTQATVKNTSDIGGNALIATGASGTGSSGADAAFLIGGLLLKALAATTNPEADIRYWHNLPAHFEIIPLKIPPHTNTLQLLKYNAENQLTEQTSVVLPDTGSIPFSTIHIHALSN